MGTHDDDEGGWWSRARAARTGEKTRNDRVADLWSSRGWDDGEYLTEDPKGLGQEKGPKYRGRSDYRRDRHDRIHNQPRRIGQSTADRAIMAHGMVQSFIGAFSDEYGYKVVYSLDAGAPAATSFEQKMVLVDPSPIFDKTISGATCGLILTALACHEVSHILFDRHHSDAVAEQVKINKALALRVSNILSDRRIENRFSARYPGYSDVFDPALEYIARDHKGRVITFDPADPGNLVVAAVRYAKWLDWSAPGMAVERDWWDDLAERAAQSDDVQWHVNHVIEGMKRLAKLKKNAPPPPPTPHPFRP